MSKEEFILLYEKNSRSECTPDELESLNSYDSDFDLEQFSSKDKFIEFKNIQVRIFVKLQSRIAVNSPNKFDWFKWRKIAAIFILSLSVATLLIVQNHKKFSVSSHLAGLSKQNDVLPGSNKAVLTLSNGNKINLNDVKNGPIAQEGNSVSNRSDGQVIYSVQNVNDNDVLVYNTITTTRGGQYKVILVDGTKVWLNASSSLKYPLQFNGNKRTVELTGEGYFEVAKNKSMPFEVKINKTKVEVLGTHFNIMGYNDEGAVKTTLIEGAVKLYNNQATALLIPGQQGIFQESSNSFVVNTVDAEEAIAWKNNYFFFRNESLRSIMKRVGRWYNVDVEFKGNAGDKRFGGTVSRSSTITELLHALEITESIHFTINERRVIIRP